MNPRFPFAEVKCLQGYPKTYGCAYKNLRISPFAVEHSVVVMTTGFQSKPIFDTRLINCVQNQWGHKILRS